MEVDRENRELLIMAIDRYLHKELTAFEFDDAIFEIREKTDDETVKQVVDLLWGFYDDCEDHKVVLDRVGWNCVQRLRLLLKSEATLDVAKKRVWSATQVVATIALVLFAWIANMTGVGQHLMIVAIPFGLVSIGVSQWRTSLYRNASNWDVALYPFTSISQILWIGKGVRGFRKEKFPLHLASRRIRGRVGTLVNRMQMYSFWLLFSPAVLVVQLLPVTVPVRRVLPNAAS